MYLDNDGMLICENAILGKAGVQKYHASELGIDSNSIILVERPEEEVFRDESLSSLRGKTLTLNHPDEDVSAENHSYLAKGFVLDVRRDGNLIRGDIKITDKDTIDLILNKDMVELSLGYETKLEYKDSNSLVQREIVYNHLALVERGRAEVARIVDGQVTRVLDKQFEKEEDTVLDNKDSVFTKILTALGLKASEENGKTVYVEDMATLSPEKEVKEVTLKADTEEEEMTHDEKVMASTVASQEMKTDGYYKDSEEPVKKEVEDETSEEEEEVRVDDEESDEDKDKKHLDTEETHEVKDEENPCWEGYRQEGMKEKDGKQVPNCVPVEAKDEAVNVTDSDETKEEGEKEMDKFDAVLDKMNKIQAIEDEDFRAQLKDALLSELTETTTKVEDESNEALEDFKNVKVEDSQIELINFDKEIQNLYDSLDPHNPKYDTYTDYVKFRKTLDREAGSRAIQQLVDEGLGGNK
jgi:hypothetical protein